MQWKLILYIIYTTHIVTLHTRETLRNNYIRNINFVFQLRIRWVLVECQPNLTHDSSCRSAVTSAITAGENCRIETPPSCCKWNCLIDENISPELKFLGWWYIGWHRCTSQLVARQARLSTAMASSRSLMVNVTIISKWLWTYIVCLV